MNWFRKHVKTGSRLALFALAIQFALSFGHFHGEVGPAAPTLQAGSADANLAIAATLAVQGTPAEAVQQPSNHDTDRHSSDCAICASSRWPTTSCLPRRRCWSCRRRPSCCT
jgi:hypothetical protein